LKPSNIPTMAARLGETVAKRKGQQRRGNKLVLSLLGLVAVLIIHGRTSDMITDVLDRTPYLPPAVVQSPPASPPQKKIPLTELTNSAASSKVECPAPLVPLHDRIVDQSSFGPHKIPRLIHIAYIRGTETPTSRCLPPDLVATVQKWKDNFPSYSFFFHRDEAVDTLLQQDWPEFPHLAKIMKTCVKFGGAIKIDIWRVLVLYKYGGIYSDIDEAPSVKFTEDAIQFNDSAFFLSDAWNRPSQWIQAMEAEHPIAYFTMLEILKRVLALEDISVIKPVFLTGPDALKFGYGKVLWGEGKEGQTIFDVGVHDGKFNKRVRKLGKGYTSDYMTQLVAWDATENITRKERAARQQNSTHWTKMIREKREEVVGGPCWDRLYEADLKNSNKPESLP